MNNKTNIKVPKKYIDRVISEYEKVKQSISEMHDFNGEKLISFIESIEKRRK